MSLTPPDGETSALSPVEADPWSFPDGAPIQIVCGTLTGDDRGPYADRSSHNHVALHEYADADALLDLAIHVSASNPRSRVSHSTVRDAPDPKSLQGHLVVLGNMAWNQMKLDPDVGVRPADVGHRIDGEVFATEEGTVEPDLSGADPSSYDDVGFIWRGPNPYDEAGTLTICSGAFTRGGLGAVRACVDPSVRTENAAFLAGKLADKRSYGMLFHVPVRDNETQTPRLDDPESRIQEFAIPS